MYVRTRPFTSALLGALPTLLIVGCGGGQDADATVAGGSSAGGGSLGAPTAAFPEDFGAIQSVREMPDGSVLVADPLGGALYSVDLDAGAPVNTDSLTLRGRFRVTRHCSSIWAMAA
jgi:hypothetical protein